MEAWTPELLKEKLDSGALVFLKLWKPGCGPCKMSLPATRRLEESNDHDLVFGSIDTEAHPEIYGITGVDSTPAFFIFGNKKMLGKSLGFKGAQKLNEFVSEAVAQLK